MLKVIIKDKVAIIRSDSGKKVYYKKTQRAYSVVDIEKDRYNEQDFVEVD